MTKTKYILNYKSITTFLSCMLLFLFTFSPSKGVYIYSAYLTLGVLCLWGIYLVLNQRFVDIWITNLMWLLISIFTIYTLISTKNTAYIIDLKNHIMIFCFLFLICFRKYIFYNLRLINSVYRFSYWLSVSVSLVYFAIYFNLIPSFYEPENLPQYLSYRVFGPSLHSFYIYILLSVYLCESNRKVITIVFLSLFCSLLSGSNQDLILTIFALLPFVFTRLSKKQAICLIFFIVWAVGLFLIYSPSNMSKVQQVLDIRNSQTILTRFSDLSYALEQRNLDFWNLVFGDGIGVKTQVFRNSGSSIDTRSFLEIDNGFYYLFHRYGLLGCSLFFLLIFSLRKLKLKLLTFVLISIIFITNLLSIHFFVKFGYFYLLLIVLSTNDLFKKFESIDDSYI